MEDRQGMEGRDVGAEEDDEAGQDVGEGQNIEDRPDIIGTSGPARWLFNIEKIFTESDDDGTGSNYSQTKREVERRRARRIGKGHATSDTEAEDDDEDMELQYDVEQESDAAPPSTQPRRKSKATAVDKGKGKASSTPGPLSNSAKEEAQEFGRQVMESADLLADKYNTSRRSILVASSLLLRETRAPNSANKHSEWYAFHFPKKTGGQYISILSSKSLAHSAFQ